MRLPSVLLAVILVVPTAGCFAGMFERPTYNMPLTEVRRPADVQQRWGEFRIERTDSTGYRYEDELLSAVLVPAGGSFVIQLQNKSSHSLAVLWDEASFVGLDGLAGRVSPGDTRVMDMEKSHPPTVIPANAGSRLVVIPNRLFSTSSAGNTLKDFVCVNAPYESLNGKEARLILPIRVQGVANEYTFVFRVSDITPPASEKSVYAGQCEEE
jgi:hypothetical protein